MAVDTIQCPHCKKRIPLSKALTGQIEESLRKELDQESRRREQELEDGFEQRLREERKKALAKAKKEVSAEIEDANSELADVRKKLDAANKKEMQLLRQQKDLKEKQATLELDVERRVAEAMESVTKKASEQASERHRLKDQEKDKKLADLAKQLEDAQRRLEQGSQQLQGEVAELDLENRLRAEFPMDRVAPVSKGARGADIVWTVRSPAGIDCGEVVWESKNAKSWSNAWLVKAKDDQRARKAACVVLVSTALPEGTVHFGYLDGVWVCAPSIAISVGTALRIQLLQVANARVAADGRDSKMENLYHYLTGTEFRQRVEALVESFVAMKDDLDQERRALEKSWAKREKQIGRAVQSLAGMYGEMQGIVGQSLPRVQTLELPAGDVT